MKDWMDDCFSEKTYWFIFTNNHLLLMKDEINNSLPDGSVAFHLKSYFTRQHSLRLQHTECYCAEIHENIILSSDISATPIRQAFEILGHDWQKIAARALSILTWDKNNQYCGRCGSKTILSIEIFERVCTVCQLSHYPRISPSIIILIKKDDHVLMARSPHFPPGAYGLIAGFIECGENIEDAVCREIKEEVGIKIKNLRYFGSQLWPFPDSLMIAFVADYESGEIVIDPSEIESAGWYKYDAIPGYPSSGISIAKKLIDYFIAEQNS